MYELLIKCTGCKYTTNLTWINNHRRYRTSVAFAKKKKKKNERERKFLRLMMAQDMLFKTKSLPKVHFLAFVSDLLRLGKIVMGNMKLVKNMSG